MSSGVSQIIALPLGPAEERVLLAQVREGRQDAFEALYRHFAGRVLRLADQLLRDRAAADDAAQETFLRVYRGVHRFRGDSGLGTWIHRIATNVCLSELSRRGRQPARAEQEPPEAPADATPGSPEEARTSALDLAPLLAELEPVKRATFYLHHVEGFTAAEVAQILGHSRDAVLKRLQRTRLELLQAVAGAGAARQPKSAQGEADGS